MGFDEATLERVREANDILEVVSDYVPLKRAGRHFKALCPFHKEKTPSFTVNVEKQIFHCFGCGEGGDAFTFIMKMENLSFPEVVTRLADRKHIVLPASRGVSSEQVSLTKELYAVFESAHRFFQDALRSPQGDRARRYLRGREFGDEVLASFQVGYAPSGWTTLFEWLSKQGFRQDLLLRAGLVTRSAQGRTIDLFRDRVMFPVRNAQGRVIAFGGRVIDEGAPKYLNSPETELFRKRRELFALSEARKALEKGEERFLIVEGYLDCLRLHAVGVTQTVATLGTSLTEEHAARLARYVPEVVLIFDGDEAGTTAALRGVPVLLEQGLHVRLVALPTDQDPDDFVRDRGRDEFLKLIEHAEDFLDFQYRLLSQRYSAREGAGLMRMARALLETLAHLKNPLLLDRALLKAAEWLKVDERSLRQELKKLRERPEWGGETPRSSPEERRPSPEFFALVLALSSEARVARLLERVRAEDFRDVHARGLFLKISAHAQESGTCPPARALAREDARAASALQGLDIIEAMDERERELAFEDCLRYFETARRGKVLQGILSKMKDQERRGDTGDLLKTVKAYQEELSKAKGKSEG